MEFVIVNCIVIVLYTVIWHVEIFSCPVAIKRKCKIQIILCLSKLSAAYSVVPVKFLLGKDHCGNNTHRHLGTYLWLDYWKIKKNIFFVYFKCVYKSKFKCEKLSNCCAVKQHFRLFPLVNNIHFGSKWFITVWWIGSYMFLLVTNYEVVIVPAKSHVCLSATCVRHCFRKHLL